MKQSMNMGGSIVSRNVLENKGRLKWCFREDPVNAVDNGWRFLSEIDTDEFLQESSNMVICDWGTIFDIEPAVMPIFILRFSFWGKVFHHLIIACRLRKVKLFRFDT